MRIIDMSIEFMREEGIALPDNFRDRLINHIYGVEKSTDEWSKEVRMRVKKAAEKELKKYSEHWDGQAKIYNIADEVVDHLWEIGWEVRPGYNNGVIGIETAVKVFIEEHYKKENAPLTIAERDDPWWLEVEAILNKFWQVDKLDDREVRMFIRNKGDIQPYIFQAVCGDLTFKGGTDIDWQPRSILKAAKEWWEVDRKHFENKNKPAPKKQTIHEYEEENKKELEAHAKWLAQLAGR
jgi:hypothetical protein